MTRFNQFLILLALIFIVSCAKLVLAKENKHCYGTETQSSLKDLQDLSQFTKNAEFVESYKEYQYNGFSVSKSEYEKLLLRDLNKHGDPNLRKP